MQRLNEIEAVGANRTDGELSLDFAPVVLESSVTYQWLLENLFESTVKSAEELTFELPGFITQLTYDA